MSTVNNSVHSFMASANRLHGFTMIELLVTLTIISVFLLLAIPGFDDARRNNLLANGANEFSASLNQARAEAIKTRRNVRICPSSNGSTCTAGGNWAGGWIMFVDMDDNDLPAAAELMRVGDALDSRVALTTPASFSSWIEFRPSGSVLGNAGNAGTFNLCSGDYHKYSRLVSISATGRITAKKQANLCAP